jgi:hypothetical protein
MLADLREFDRIAGSELERYPTGQPDADTVLIYLCSR